MNKYSESSLKNGLRVITAEVPGSGVVTIKVVVKAGSRFEKEGQRGIAHIFEHMLWRGTKNRPIAYDISLITDRSGSGYNAETTIETISTFIQVAKNEAGRMAELLSDIIQNPLFDQGVLQNEIRVILQEMRQIKDSRDRRMWMETVETIFAGHPLSNYPIGLEDDIKLATSDKLRAYHEKFFVANNMALIFSGGISHEESVGLAKKYFSSIKSGDVEGNSKDIMVIGGEKTVNFPGSQTTLNLCFSGHRLSEKEAKILDLVANYLGYKQTSLLYQELRSKKGLIYGIKAYSVQYQDASVFCINTSTINPDEVKNNILEKLFNFEKYFTADILTEYKNQLKNILIRTLDGEETLNNFISKAWVHYNKLVTPERSLELIEKIEYAEVIEVVGKTFKNDNLFVIRLQDEVQKADGLT